MGYRSLIICATPRSGTTLLCDLLTETGTAGRPNSFYRRESLDAWVRRLNVETGPDFDRRFLGAVVAEGTAGTGLFSMRIMWPSLPEMTAALASQFPGETTDADRITAAFGTPLYLLVTRRDKLAQAISRVKAEQSGLWHKSADGSVREQENAYRSPSYDRAALDASIAETAAHEAAWRNWFAAQGIAPLELAYEDLAAEPVAAVRELLSALGRDPSRADRIAPRTSRLTDAQSRDWARRYARLRPGRSTSS